MRRTPLKRTAGLRAKKPMIRKKKPSLEELQASGLVQKASTLKPKKKMRKRAPKKPGEISQIEFFMGIWNERPHVSEISGLPLVDPPDDWEDAAAVRAWLSQASHILPKGSYKKMKYDPRNVVLKTAHEHELWETKKWTLRDDPKWDWVFRLEEALKAEANGVESY